MRKAAMVRGTDIHPFYQRGIRWDQVTGVNFVWVKVSDGGAPYSTTNGGVRYTPDSHVAGAKSRNIRVGGYHYAQLGPAPEVQADVLVNEVRRLGALGVAPMLDLESPFIADATARDFGIRFCKRVAAAGYRPAVYMNSSFARALRPDQWDVPGLVIVVARYGNLPDAVGPAQYVGHYDVHQYTSSGSLPGSAGAVDFDESYTNTLFDVTTGDDMALTDDQAKDLLNKVNYLFTVFQRYRADQPNGEMRNGVWYGDGAEVSRQVLKTVAGTVVPSQESIVAGFNALGAQLAQVFTAIDADLTEIKNALHLDTTTASRVSVAADKLKDLIDSVQPLTTTPEVSQ